MKSPTTRRLSTTLLAGALMTAALAVSTVAAPSQDAPQEEKEWRVPRRKQRVPNPVPADAKALAVGKAAYERECLSCHGETGRGDGPAAKDLDKTPGNLTDPKMRDQTDGALFWKVSTGRSPMPAFDATFTEEERWSIVHYVRTLVRDGGADKAPPLDARGSMGALVSSYLTVQGALAAGDLKSARAAVPKLAGSVEKLTAASLEALDDKARADWERDRKSLGSAAGPLARAETLPALRGAFAAFSAALSPAVGRFGHTQAGPLLLVHCPRAEDGTGAAWLQLGKELRNPYLGPAVLDCGEVRASLPAKVEKPEGKEPPDAGGTPAR